MQTICGSQGSSLIRVHRVNLICSRHDKQMPILAGLKPCSILVIKIKTYAKSEAFAVFSKIMLDRKYRRSAVCVCVGGGGGVIMMGGGGGGWEGGNNDNPFEGFWVSDSLCKCARMEIFVLRMNMSKIYI